MENTLSTKPETSRNYSLDVLRVLATLLIVLLHSCGRYVDNFASSPTSIEFITGNLLDSICRVGVPIFVMISGALLLREEKEITIKTALKKALYFASILIVWSAFYVAYTAIDDIFKQQPLNLTELLKSFLFGHYHLWYLYMLIGLYLITPILKLITKRENSKIVLYFIVLSLVFQFIIPIIEVFSTKIYGLYLITTLIDKLYLGFLATYITYYLLGWYLFNVGFNKKDSTLLLILGIASLLSIILLGFLFSSQIGTIYSNENILVLGSATAFFIVFSKLNVSEKIQPFLLTFSKLSFGIYVLHPLILSLIIDVIPMTIFPFVRIMILWFTSLLGSALLSFAISKIPFVKKIVHN